MSRYYYGFTRREIRAMRRTRIGRLWFWIWYGN